MRTFFPHWNCLHWSNIQSCALLKILRAPCHRPGIAPGVEKPTTCRKPTFSFITVRLRRKCFVLIQSHRNFRDVQNLMQNARFLYFPPSYFRRIVCGMFRENAKTKSFFTHFSASLHCGTLLPRCSKCYIANTCFLLKYFWNQPLPWARGCTLP